MKNDAQQVIPLIKDTYLAVIKNSLGSKMFQHFYAEVDGVKQDIMKGGELSCAFFVSSITTLFDFTTKVHGTVNNTEKDLLESGWKHIENPEIGSVIIWDEMDFNAEKHKHIGFYVGNDQAISNSCFEKVPKQHHWTFADKREVIRILWNERLNEESLVI